MNVYYLQTLATAIKFPSMIHVRICRLSMLTAFLIFASFPVSAQSVPKVLLPGHVRAAIAKLTPTGRLDGATPLNLSISLPLRNREALTNLLEQLYDPASPAFHHYLSPEEFDARFGPTEADYQAVLDFAERKGLTVTGRHPNRMLLELSAPATNIEHAFQVTLRTYEHPTEKRTFFAPDTDPAIEAALPLVYIGGLDDYSQPRPQNLRRALMKPSAMPAPQVIGSGPNGILAGFDYRAAYVPGTTLTGAGQSVGLVEFDGYYAGDIPAYETDAGVPSVPLQNILLDGFSGTPTKGLNSGNGEVALDIEMAISMAPGLSKVVVYEDNPRNSVFNNVLEAMSTNTAVKQFSCSWAFPTFGSAERTSMDSYFLKFAAQGQSFFEAAGDSGADVGGIQTPIDDPYVTVVGGTTLATAGPRGPWLSETAWNAEQGPGVYAGGGGISTIYGIPTWQQGVNMGTNQGSTTMRNFPDVAMVADNIFIVADNGQEENTGGTSAAAPLWAGFAALINQQATAKGVGPIGFVNPALYNIGTNFSYKACFDDIVRGNTTNTVINQFIAGPGYDLCTGLGSPAGISLINALTVPDGFTITPGRGVVANGPAGGPFTVSSLSLTLTNIGKPAFNWSAGTTANWLNLSNTQGTLNLGASAAVTLSLNSSAASLSPGLYTANIWFTNLTSGLPQVRQFTLQVSEELVQDGGFEAGDFTYWALGGAADIFNNIYVDFSSDTSGADYTAHSGQYFAVLSETNELGYLSQCLPTRAGQKYTLSFWLANPVGGAGNQFQVQWNPNASATNIVFNQSNMGSFNYSNFVFTVQATTNMTTLEFGCRNDLYFFALDDVSVLPQMVPVPNIASPLVANGTVQFNFTAVPGVQYQVQYRTNLVLGSWANAGGVINATTNPIPFTDTTGSGSQRFYRVELVP
jgi:subtilase family serine protease